MIPVSTEWRSKISEQFRDQGYMKVIVEVVPPGLMEGAQAAPAKSEPYTDASFLISAPELTLEKIATFEPNRWLLDGSFRMRRLLEPIPEWWSTFAADDPHAIAFVFDAMYSFPGMTFTWDTVEASKPKRLTIRGYGPEGALLHEYVVTEIANYIEAPMQDVSKVTITVDEWALPLWRARIAKISFGLYVSYDSINNGRVMESSSIDATDPLASALPVHYISFDLRNLDQIFDPTLETGISKYLTQRQRIQVAWGFSLEPGRVEWSPPLSYFLSETLIEADSKNVTISAGSRLDFMTKELRRISYTGGRRSLQSLALEVLESSDIIKSKASEKPWDISGLSGLWDTMAPLGVMPANEALQLIASAGMCSLHIEPQTGYITMRNIEFLNPESATADCDIGLAQQLGDPSIAVKEQVRSITICAYSYTKLSRERVLASISLDKKPQTVYLEYSVPLAADVTYDVIGCVVTEFVSYGSSAKITVEPDGSNSSISIMLWGYEVAQSSTRVETYRNNSIAYGLDLVIDNPLITYECNIDGYFERLTQCVLRWYSRPQKVQMPYIGYPEVNAGDIANVTTTFQENAKSYVSRNEIRFNGAFEGTMEVL